MHAFTNEGEGSLFYGIKFCVVILNLTVGIAELYKSVLWKVYLPAVGKKWNVIWLERRPETEHVPTCWCGCSRRQVGTTK